MRVLISPLLFLLVVNFQHCHSYSIRNINGNIIDQDRVCDPDKTNYLFTGFRVERQIVIRESITHQTHLIVCKEGRVVSDIIAPSEDDFSSSSVPWAKTICNQSGTNCYKISRRKTFALRDLAVFFPNKLIGGVFKVSNTTYYSELAESFSKEHPGRSYKLHTFDEDDSNFYPLAPLMSSNVLNQWIEVAYNGVMVYHIPLFHSLEESAKRPNKSDRPSWFTYISPNEKYTYDDAASSLFQRAHTLVSNEIVKAIGIYRNEIIKLPFKSTTPVALKKAFGGYITQLLSPGEADEKEKFSIFGSTILLSHIMPKAYYRRMLASFDGLMEEISFKEEVYGNDMASS